MKADGTPHPPLPGTAARVVQRSRDGHLSQIEDLVAEEAPVALIYDGASFAVMMATPCDLEDFARGFSLSEGLVERADGILSIETVSLLEGIQLHIATAPDTRGAALSAQGGRSLPGRGSCGICGTRELEDAVRPAPRVRSAPAFHPDMLERALAELPAHQPMNAVTGAVHAACWVDADGRIVLAREDVGRHNALDKLIGAMSVRDIATDAGMLLLTSRASYEMVTKAARAGIGLIAAISAPTALAVDLARGAGIRLVGFARRGGYNLYTQPEQDAGRSG